MSSSSSAKSPTSRMKDYPLATSLWTNSSSVVIRSDYDTRIAVFPLDFIRQGGDNTWSYVLYVVRQLVVLEPDQLGQLQDENGAALDLNEAPKAGTFRFHIEGSQSDVTFSTGPEYFSRFKAPNPFGSVSTRSNSRRSSINQSNFRLFLAARDGCCIVTGEDFSLCTAAHIVPCSRPDLYEQFFENGQSVFLPSSGLILRNDLHHAFDMLQLSLYEKVGEFLN
nr:hypothetical protein L203_06670 [Cryptococcus depauperatus CBS 7841]